MSINIGEFELGGQTFIIAEAGVNHNGEVEKAKELVDVAEKAGVDAVKFQIYQTDEIMIESAPKAEYQKEETDEEQSQKEMSRDLELTQEEFEEVLEYTEDKDVQFLCSPFDKESADKLSEMGVNAFKIGSGEITNIPLLKHIARKNKPIILSTGMSKLGEVEEAVEAIEEEGNSRIVLLHCVSNYPADIESSNLKAMDTLKQAFNKEVGWSGHTLGLTVPVAAVSRGAKVIEKHFTLDKNLPGPDHQASLNPEELRKMVDKIRKTEKALGDGIKKPVEEELETKEVARKSITTTKEIREGEEILAEALSIRRPGTGIEPKYIDEIKGKKASQDIEANSVLKWEDIR